MSEEHDPFEAELAAFRPRELSPASQRRIAGRLADPSPRRSRWLWGLGLAGGMAAACLVAISRGWGPGGGQDLDTRPTIAVPTTAPPGVTEDVLPTHRAYQQALTRSPEDLNALLDRHAARGFGSGPGADPRLVRIRAFALPDPEVRAFSGDL
jgi:hypothetical protein